MGREQSEGLGKRGEGRDGGATKDQQAAGEVVRLDKVVLPHGGLMEAELIHVVAVHE